jgi:hypothetical protein
MNLVKKYLFYAFAIRILVLIILNFFFDGEISGFNGDTYLKDDVRYAKGALYYSQNADNLIDYEVFTYSFEQFGDFTGYAETFSFWYWFVCIVTYLFKYILALRIINILFAVLTAYYIYKLGSIIFNKKVGKYALIFYCFNPYFIFFSLFIYKDQFIALILVQLFYYLYSYFISNKNKYLFYVLIVLALFSFLRSGFSIILIASVLVLFVIREKEYSNRFNLKKFFYFLPIFIASVYFTTFYFIDNFDTIQRKLVAYVIERAISESDTIAMFQISSFSDFYKLPFSFIFALLQPINLTSKILSVSGFVGVINLFGIFLASGNILALFDKKIRGLNFTWIINALFIITLITSLGVSRHYYFMLPFYVIFLSAYITKKNNFVKTLFSSVALTLLISVFYLFRIS